ncbi:MAG: HD domain-containing phosphohydrolase [Gallionella sp.]
MTTNNYSDPFSLLTIDDDERLRRSIRSYFEDSGIKVYEACDGQAGLEMFREHRPDIVLVDLSMPVMGGLEFIEQLRLEAPDQPVIIFSGTASLQSSVDAVHREVWDFVTKPVLNMAALERTVRRCLERARLKRENEQYRLHLEGARTTEPYATRQQVVERQDRASKYPDNKTDMHVMRVSRYAQLLALKAGMSSHEADLLLLAVHVHNLGKTGIPDAILLKRGGLTEDEWKSMMAHAGSGDSIVDISPSEIMQMARTLALTHHEKWNGKGYPNGLVGGQIPLAGRIVAIADAFDALTSTRPYKQPQLLDKTLDYIRREAGQQFDPDLVQLFLENIPEVLSIQTECHD